MIDQKEVVEFIAIEPVEEQEYYDVSASQSRLWVLDQLVGESIAYNMPSVFRIRGELDIDSLNRAFRILVERHESLRTSFITREGVLKQVITTPIEFYIEQTTASASELVPIIIEHSSFIFDLFKGPLFNVKLVNTGEQDHTLLINMHHIISDRWSMDTILKELVTHYTGKTLPPLPIQYKDYVRWQDQVLEGAKIDPVKEFWHQKFSGGHDIPLLDLPTDFPRPAFLTYNGAAVVLRLNTSLTSAVNHLCRQQGVTLFMVLLATVNVLIYHYTRQEDIIFGTHIAGRDHPDLENQVGFYVNTLALRNRFTEGQTFESFLRTVKQTVIEAYENQIYPFDRLVGELALARDTSRHPLFDVMILLQASQSVSFKLDDIEITPINYQRNINKFDLTFHFEENSGHLQATIYYNANLFKPDFIQQLCIHLQGLVNSIVKNPSQLLETLNIISHQEKLSYDVEDEDIILG
jgi:hypothetical protein